MVVLLMPDDSPLRAGLLSRFGEALRRAAGAPWISPSCSRISPSAHRAILAAGSLRGGSGVGDDTRRWLAALIAEAFWRLFNRPAVISLLRQLAAGTAAVRDESAYWRLVLHYCRQGNLQAVLDEQWHLLWDQESWSEDARADETAAKCARKLVQVVHPARARVHAEFFRAEQGASGATVERDELRVRTVFALRFGHVRTDDGEHISQDAVRAAFNSPFRPFVLTSTSIGQEGLDFHPWRHRLVHWNLPGNPVDLEQREGWIHRYKGHAVRRNVAASHAEDAFAAWSAGDDIWKLMLELANEAARAVGESDLVPHWMAPGEHRVERHVPQLPYTAKVEAFDRLKRQLAAYRVVFGQPRQEELVTLLDRAGVEVARLRDWAVNLSPPATQSERADSVTLYAGNASAVASVLCPPATLTSLGDEIGSPIPINRVVPRHPARGRRARSLRPCGMRTGLPASYLALGVSPYR